MTGKRPTPPRDAEIKLRAISISAGLLSRHIIDGAHAIANGSGNVWSIRKRANHMFSEIFQQMTRLGVEYKPKRKSPTPKKKEGIAHGDDHYHRQGQDGHSRIEEEAPEKARKPA